MTQKDSRDTAFETLGSTVRAAENGDWSFRQQAFSLKCSCAMSFMMQYVFKGDTFL
jgi:hypothetical protein